MDHLARTLHLLELSKVCSGWYAKNSRLFFILLGAIRAMQELVQVKNVRYLVENAGSMVDLHYQAFCDLLGLTPQPKSRFLWDPADHGFGITRKRNFFRDYEDCQEIAILLQEGKLIALPPSSEPEVSFNLKFAGHLGRCINHVP